MFKHYLICAYRNFIKYRVTSVINIIGLSISIYIAIMILAIRVKKEGYDQFHPKHTQTYRVITQLNLASGSTVDMATSSFPLSQELSKYHGAEFITRIYPLGKTSLKGKAAVDADGAMAEQTFFDVFGFNLKVGNEKNALAKPRSIILSRQMAINLFGTKDPMGEVVEIEDKGSFTVTGILKEADHKTHLDFQFYISMASLPMIYHSKKLQDIEDNWANLKIYTYATLKDGVSSKDFQLYINEIFNTYSSLYLSSGKALSFSGFKAQHIEDIVYNPITGDTLEITSIPNVRLYSLVGLIVFILSLINYTNITVTKSMGRSKEYGMRRIIGSSKKQIIALVISEAVFLSMITTFVTYLFILIIPSNPFNGIFNEVSLNGSFIYRLFILAFIIGLIAGIVPAVILSKVKPIQALQQIPSIMGLKHVKLRNILITFQFGTSLVALMVLLTNQRQIEYGVNYDLGFDTENIITIKLKDVDHKVFKDQLYTLPDVKSVNIVTNNFQFGMYDCHMGVEGKEPISVPFYSVDESIIDCFDLELIAGKTFPEGDSIQNEKYIIINERGLKHFFNISPAEAIGQQLIIDDSISVSIIGVVKDFYHSNLKFSLGPMMLRYLPIKPEYINVKTASSDYSNVLFSINKIWKSLKSGFPLEYEIYGEALKERRSYREDQNKLSLITIMAITITFIGLFGMVYYSVESRFKEIAIRKIQGAGIIEILWLVSKEFLIVIGISIFMTMPIGYLICLKILQQFVYKTNIGFVILAGSVGSLILLSFLTLGSQIRNIVSINPIKIIRN